MDDDVDMTQLLQALQHRLSARSTQVSGAAQEHGHAPQPSAVGGRRRPLAGADDGSADHEAPRDNNNNNNNNNGGTLPGGGGHHLQRLRRGLSGESFDEIMEFAMRLSEHDGVGDILERICDKAVAAGVLTPIPEDIDSDHQQHHDDDEEEMAEQIFYQAFAAEVLIPVPDWLLDQGDNDGGSVDGGGRGFGGGGVPASSSSGVVAGLEKRKYQQRSGEDDDGQCPICLMDYAVDDDLYVMPCKHGFHHECLAGWLARSYLCPLCRHVLMPSEEQQDVP